LLCCRRNENILQELRVDPVENKLAQYKGKLLIPGNSIPKTTP
jgi:hypothetical protein